MLIPATLPVLIRLKVLPAFPFEVFRIFGVIDQRNIRLLSRAPNPKKIFQIDPAPRSLGTRWQTRATPEGRDDDKDRPS